MTEYIAKGTVIKTGVTFYLTADSLAAAKQKAKDGDFAGYHANSAKTVEWEIDPYTVEEYI